MKKQFDWIALHTSEWTYRLEAPEAPWLGDNARAVQAHSEVIR
jgi:hypothetical protein